MMTINILVNDLLTIVIESTDLPLDKLFYQCAIRLFTFIKKARRDVGLCRKWGIHA